MEVKNYYGTKKGTYHWDEALDADGNLAGHAPNNSDGLYRHLQIHTWKGDVIRIFFGPSLK